MSIGKFRKEGGSPSQRNGPAVEVGQSCLVLVEKIDTRTMPHLLLLICLSRLLLMLIRQASLRIRALRIALAGIHLTAAGVLLRAVNLLRLGVLSWRLASRAVADRRQLRPAHLVWYHVGLAVLTRSALRIRIGTIPGGFLAHTFFFLLALVLLFLFLRFPFCRTVSMTQGVSGGESEVFIPLRISLNSVRMLVCDCGWL